MERLFGIRDFSKLDYKFGLVFLGSGVAGPVCFSFYSPQWYLAQCLAHCRSWINICKKKINKNLKHSQDSYLELRHHVFQTAALSKERPLSSRLDSLRWFVHDFSSFLKQGGGPVALGHTVIWSVKRVSTVCSASWLFSFISVNFCHSVPFPFFSSLRSIETYFWLMLERELIVLGR